jgi:hypothetical protein
MTQLSEVTQYRVRHGRHVATVASLKTAANRVAWWMIFDKYRSDEPMSSNDPWHPRIECNCHKAQDDWDADWLPCPLHNRQDGYFRRLHTRLSRQLLAQFKDGKQ